jgi:hypothetical protein
VLGENGDAPIADAAVKSKRSAAHAAARITQRNAANCSGITRFHVMLSAAAA